MVDLVEPSFDSVARSRTTAAAIRYAGGSEDGWVQPNSSRLISDPEGNLATGALNAFAETHSGSSLDLTVQSGEALVGGAYLARDTNTTVTVASSTNNQSVFVGYKDSTEDTVIIGLSGDFSSNDPKMEIYSVDSDSNGITSVTDNRNLDNYRVRNEDAEFTQNLTADETLNQHPLGSGDIASDAVTATELDESSVDAGDLGGSSGTSGQVLSTDGTNANWSSTSPIDPIYGDGSDGSITRSSDANENGLIYATDYTIENGVTMTVSNSVLVVHATNSITISGTLTAAGQATTGGSGGAGGTSGSVNGSAGSAGSNGDVSGSGAAGGSGPSTATDSGGGDDGTGAGAGGGGGASNDDNDGGDGGASGGTDFSSNQIRQLRMLLTSSFDTIYDLSMLAGASGGGGGGGGFDDQGTDGGDGGKGGDGGGVIVLISQSIDISSGSVSADGTAGNDGASASNGAGDGGGGGGGSGGLVILAGQSISGSSNATASGGAGGAGGDHGLGDLTGGDGIAGEVGLTLTMSP